MTALMYEPQDPPTPTPLPATRDLFDRLTMCVGAVVEANADADFVTLHGRTWMCPRRPRLDYAPLTVAGLRAARDAETDLWLAHMWARLVTDRLMADVAGFKGAAS